MVGWHYRQRRVETLHVALSQEIVGESAGRTKTFTLRLEDITDEEGGEPASGRFFETPRGRRLVEHLIQKAFTSLEASRGGDVVTVDVPFETILTLTCRHRVTLQHPSEVGATLTGKVVFYELKMDGATGEKIRRVSLALTRERTAESETRVNALRQGFFQLVDEGGGKGLTCPVI